MQWMYYTKRLLSIPKGKMSIFFLEISLNWFQCILAWTYMKTH